MDADGCLTDGKKYVDATGQRQMIAFHSRDSIACKALVEMGFQVIVLTHSEFKGIRNYWEKYGAKVIHATGAVKKNIALDTWGNIEDWEKTIGIGDDVTDICYLEKCKIALMPYDKHPKLWDVFSTENNQFTMDANGGEGLLSILADDIQNGFIEKVTQHAEH